VIIFRDVIINTFLIFTLVATNVRNGHQCACTDACTFLICLKRHVTIQSEGCSWQIQYRCRTTFGTLYIWYHKFSLHNKPAVSMPAVKLWLWNGTHTAFNYAFHCLSLEWILKRPGQLLLTFSALQLAVEHMPVCTDWWKINNIASHIIQTIPGDHTVSYPMGIYEFFPRSKAAGAWIWKSILLISKLKNKWSYTLFPLMFAWCWEKKN
jgi:hypothetical protein